MTLIHTENFYLICPDFFFLIWFYFGFFFTLKVKYSMWSTLNFLLRSTSSWKKRWLGKTWWREHCISQVSSSEEIEVHLDLLPRDASASRLHSILSHQTLSINWVETQVLVLDNSLVESTYTLLSSTCPGRFVVYTLCAALSAVAQQLIHFDIKCVFWLSYSVHPLTFLHPNL